MLLAATLQNPRLDDATFSVPCLTLPRVSNIPYAISERRLTSSLLVDTLSRPSAAEMAGLSPLQQQQQQSTVSE
jgi:hypothetical protein